MIGVGILFILFSIAGLTVTGSLALLIFAAIGIAALYLGDKEDDDPNGGA